MGNPKSKTNPPPVVYRDEPGRASTPSMASAMHMSDIEYPEEETPLSEGFPEDELPPYSDIVPDNQASPQRDPISYLTPPPVPQTTLSGDKKFTICNNPLYSQDPVALEAMIREQAAYPPNYAFRLRGTHNETSKTRNGKTERKSVVDFDIRVNMTYLLVCPNPVHTGDIRPCDVPSIRAPAQEPPQEYSTPSCKYIKLLGPGERGYRGTIVKSLTGSTDPEASTSLTSWCNAYVADPSPVKNFVLNRQVVHHDTTKLEGYLRDLVHHTGYRGHTYITFETTYEKVLVCSPNFINKWRFNAILFWFFILTFLWIFTWPILFFSTKRYEVLTAIFPYRQDPFQNRQARPLVQSETQFFEEWKQALNKAVLDRHQGWVDEIYREETAQMARSLSTATGEQNTQNNIHGLVAGAVRVALGLPASRGWGADS